MAWGKDVHFNLKAISAAVLLLAGHSALAQAPSEQQNKFCEVARSVPAQIMAYDARKSQANPIVQAQMGPRPSSRDFTDLFVSVLGKDGHFVDFVGNAVNVMVSGKLATITVQINCGPVIATFMTGFSGNPNSTLVNATQQMPFESLPFDNPLVQFVATLPNTAVARTVLVSGYLLYSPGNKSNKEGYVTPDFMYTQGGGPFVARFTSITATK